MVTANALFMSSNSFYGASSPGRKVLSQHPKLSALSQLSANLGRNPLLVQAATGNTSIKIGSKLWVKASGKWLAHADRNDTFIPVDLAEIRGCIDKKIQYAAEYRNSSGACVEPSVEASMHALMPHQVVIHVHAVNTIAWAVRRDGPTHLAARLAGLSWQWIPYVSSGLPLALQIQAVMSSSPDVLILANHGLVVGGESCEAAEALLKDVEDRLAAVPRSGSEPQWSQLERMAASEPCWRVPDDAVMHALATDATSRAILLGGTLYPCQAVSFGPSTAVIPSDGRISDSEHRHHARYGVSPTFFIVEGTGVLVRQHMTVAQSQVLEGLSQVVQRIDAEAPIRYLTTADLNELSTTAAHRYQRLENRFEESINTSALQTVSLLGSRK
jgi:rhamnose utilization protein RhaD (predicted bifunctional aldolase and dehydrogenase)